MSTRIKRALIICDMQPDIMPSLFAHPSPPPSVDPKARREAFADAVQTVFLAAISSPLAADNSLVLFTGLRFPSGYEGLYPEHSLYGSLRRLNQKVGDKMAHWFMENYPGSEIDSSLMDLVKGREDLNYEVLWRTGHLPPSDLMQQLKKHSITDATVVGAKASQTVQSTVQYIAEHCPSIDLSVVEEAIADDRQDRLDAITQHLLPLYARVATIEEYTDATCGSEKLALALEEYSHKKRQNVKYYVDCERGGHYSLYIHHLTHRQSLGSNGTSWVKYPRQKWYEDVFCGKQYHCPLGKRVVDFCDEPSFSTISMFLKGRDCLDDKAKLLKIAKEYLPETYVVKGGAESWDTVEPCPTEVNESYSSDTQPQPGPWFVNETNKKGGRAITVCTSASDCIPLANNPNKTYVIQRHVPFPSLLKDGRKWHLKIYNFLICDEDGINWTLRSHKEAFLCAASVPWSTEDLSPEAQLTICRSKRFRSNVVMEELDVDCHHLFEKCTGIVATVVGRAIGSNKLQGRTGKKQFEIFSSDFIFNTDYKAHLIEFNFSPVLFDPLAKQELTTKGLKAYMKESAINDHTMVKDVISMVFYPKQAFDKVKEGEAVGGWEYIKSFCSTNK